MDLQVGADLGIDFDLLAFMGERCGARGAGVAGR
jgi:hypothetical protein